MHVILVKGLLLFLTIIAILDVMMFLFFSVLRSAVELLLFWMAVAVTTKRVHGYLNEGIYMDAVAIFER